MVVDEETKKKMDLIANEAWRLMNDNPTLKIGEAVEMAKKIYEGDKNEN